MSENCTLECLSVNNGHILVCEEVKSVEVLSIGLEEEICLGLLDVNDSLEEESGAVLNVLSHRVKIC